MNRESSDAAKDSESVEFLIVHSALGAGMLAVF
jgi:hypothetical protein